MNATPEINKLELNKYLRECSSLSMVESFFIVVGFLPDPIKNALTLPPAASMQHRIAGLVNACVLVEGGLKKLIEILEEFDKGQTPFINFLNYLQENAPHLLPSPKGTLPEAPPKPVVPEPHFVPRLLVKLERSAQEVSEEQEKLLRRRGRGRNLELSKAVLEQPFEQWKRVQYQAWLFTSRDPKVAPIALNSEEAEWEREEIGFLFWKLVNKVADSLEQPQDNSQPDLVLELLLPFHMLTFAFERWQIPSRYSVPEALVDKFPVVVRSLDRFNQVMRDDYKYLRRDWEKSWNSLKATMCKPAYYEPIRFSSYSRDMEAELIRQDHMILPILTAQPLAQDPQVRVFETLINLNLSVAGWPRQNNFETDITCEERTKELEELFDCRVAENLPENIWKKRRVNYSQKEHLAHRLTILYDNPYRLPPAVTTTGNLGSFAAPV